METNNAEQKSSRIIELADVSKEFDGVSVVENFNLYVRKGEFITFLGPSPITKVRIGLPKAVVVKSSDRKISGYRSVSAKMVSLQTLDVVGMSVRTMAIKNHLHAVYASEVISVQFLFCSK